MSYLAAVRVNELCNTLGVAFLQPLRRYLLAPAPELGAVNLRPR